MDFENLIYKVDNGVLTITLNRPEVLNALSTKLKDELGDAFQKAEKDKSVKSIIITGAGNKGFCAGQDLNESKGVDEETAKAWVDEFENLYRIIKSVTKPIIASINGSVAGSGLQLALLADIRIASPNAKFGMTEVNVGLPCIIGSTMFWEVMGKSKTIDLILTGRLLKAKEAYEYDLITRLAESQESLQEETLKIAEEMAAKPPVAVSTNKKWLNKLSQENFDACMIFAKEAHTISYRSNEPQDMMNKFLSKQV